MRDDLHKVVTERPRTGPRLKTVKGSRRQMQGKLEYCGGKESMTKRYVAAWCDRQFSDLLGPLKRFILSCTGRRWDDVFSEICKKFPESNVSYSHVKDHLLRYVLTESNFVLIDGQPCEKQSRYGRGEGDPIYAERYGALVWVHPVTGILKRLKKKPAVKAPNYGNYSSGKFLTLQFHKKVQEIDGKLYSCIDGIWYEVFLKDATNASHYDLVEKRHLYVVSEWGTTMQMLYGRSAYVYKKLQLNSDRLAELKVQNVSDTSKTYVAA